MKCDAQVDINTFDDYADNFGCKWFKPKSSEDAQILIDKCSELSKQVNNCDYTWIITKFVETEPGNKKFGKFSVNVNGGGAHGGDDCVDGKCNGTDFTGIRKHAASFSRPNTFQKGCCWDSDLKYFFLILESN